MEDQCRLQELGFSAHLPSAHCRGWAADLEVAWLERFGARGALVEVLQDYQRRGLVNAIDEGRIWHICLNPQHAAAFAPPAGPWPTTNWNTTTRRLAECAALR